MTAEAANCLLKTLEEPPGDTVFILLSSRPQILLPTILSRCQQLVFKGIPAGELAGSLAGTYGLPAEVAVVTAALSGGSMGKAHAYTSGSFDQERNAAIKLAGDLNKGGLMEALGMAEKIAEKKDKVFSVLEMLTCWYRDLLVCRETGEDSFLYNLDQAETVKK